MAEKIRACCPLSGTPRFRVQDLGFRALGFRVLGFGRRARGKCRRNHECRVGRWARASLFGIELTSIHELQGLRLAAPPCTKPKPERCGARVEGLQCCLGMGSCVFLASSGTERLIYSTIVRLFFWPAVLYEYVLGTPRYMHHDVVRYSART